MDRLSSERLEETTRLGSYEIIRRLARGGMAELFLARGRDGVVVLKKILPKHANTPRLVQLFLDEARLAGSLDHPNIVRTLGAGQDRGTAFFAMEYLHGQDVRTMLHRAWTLGEQVPIEHAVHIASHVAAALHYAHEQRGPDGQLLELVHRDVSPSNILVSYDGAVKLADFGVAKATTSTVKTRSGALKGKIAYMSPEQAKGSAIDRRSDLFSLGIVLWEMITTQRLFRGENDLQTLQLIINQPPRRPSELQPACEPELERIVLRALAQEPAARYQTAAEILTDLDELACVQGLDIDAGALSAYLARLFAPELRSWEEAKAAGATLAQHLTNGGDRTIQLTESDFIEAVDLDAMLEAEAAEDEDEGDGEGGGEGDGSEMDRTEIQMPPEHAVAAGEWPPPAAARMPTPPAPQPIVRAQAPTPMPVPHVVAPAMPMPMPMPMPPPPAPLPPLPAMAGDELAEVPSPGPWSIARGSSVTPSGGLPTVPAPPPSGEGGFVLDPELADRLLRRGLWVGAAIVGFVVVISIILAAAA